MNIEGTHSGALFRFLKHNILYYKEIDSKHNILGCKDADAKHNNLYCKVSGVVVKTCINDNANACRSSCDFYGFYQ